MSAFLGLIGYTPANRPESSEEVQFPFFLTINTLGKIVTGHKYNGVMDDKFGRAEVRDFCFDIGVVDFTRKYLEHVKLHLMGEEIEHHGELVYGTEVNDYLQRGFSLWNCSNERGSFSLEPFPNDNGVRSDVALHFYEQFKNVNDERLEIVGREELVKIRAKLGHTRNCNS